MSSITGSPGTPISGIETLRAKSGWIVALGAVYIIAGIVAIGSVVIATVATVFIVGIMMLIAGVAEVINAFQIKTWASSYSGFCWARSISLRAFSRSRIRFSPRRY
jgi:uncharacterized membrane protein HdeD (DUF308 family)